jgi:hypothetical protein
MNLYTKIAYFSLLAMISLSQFIKGNYTLAAVLLIITCVAMPLYEKREAKRQFYRALRKLYVCVDLDAFIKERERLVKHALFKSVIKTPLSLLKIIEAYYHGDRESLVGDLLRLNKNVDYQFWIDSYLGLCDVTRIDSTTLMHHIAHVPSYYREIAVQRIEVLELKRKLHDDNEADTSEIDALRERVTFNLLVAELTQYLMMHAQNERIRNYYEKAVLNLSKGLML